MRAHQEHGLCRDHQLVTTAPLVALLLPNQVQHAHIALAEPFQNMLGKQHVNDAASAAQLWWEQTRRLFARGFWIRA